MLSSDIFGFVIQAKTTLSVMYIFLIVDLGTFTIFLTSFYDNKGTY
jgi:hypothetical protein